MKRRTTWNQDAPPEDLAAGVIHGIEAHAIGTAGPSNWTGPNSQMVV